MCDRFADLPCWFAALHIIKAALYCGLSPDTFKPRCPLKPIRLGKTSGGDRYLRVRLDEWLLSLDTNPPPKTARRGMLEILRDAQRS
jgi:hypothetical protein